MEYSIATIAELESTVKEVLASLVPRTSATVLALHGDLGAGKTTFVQTLARALKVEETVTSPTFVVMKSYQTEHSVFERLVHIDAYRIEDIDEMRPLRFAELLAEPKNLICIEWAERIEPLLPSHTQHLTLEGMDTTRTLTLS